MSPVTDITSGINRNGKMIAFNMQMPLKLAFVVVANYKRSCGNKLLGDSLVKIRQPGYYFIYRVHTFIVVWNKTIRE